ILPVRLFLGQPDGADRRLAEYRGRHVLVIHLDRVAVVERLGDGAALGDRDGRQVQPVGDIADRVDVGYAGALPFIDEHRALVASPDADLVEPEPPRVRATAGRVHDQIGRDFLAGRREHRIALAWRLLDARDLGSGVDLDAA